MRQMLALMFAAAAAFAPMTADAQETSTAAAPRPSPLAVRTGAAFLAGEGGGRTLMRGDVSVGVGYTPIPALTLHGDVHFGTTRFAYAGSLEDGLAVDGVAWSYFDVSAEVGAIAHLLRSDPFVLDAFFSYEGSVGRTAPVVDRLRITTDQGSYDVGPYAADNVSGQLYWHRISVGATFGVRWRMLTPRLIVGFDNYIGTYDLQFSPDARAVVGRLGFDAGRLETSHQMTLHMVRLGPGLGIRCSDRVDLDIGGVIAPGFDNLMYGGSLGLNIKL
jgi:hypothetical protein